MNDTIIDDQPLQPTMYYPMVSLRILRHAAFYLLWNRRHYNFVAEEIAILSKAQAHVMLMSTADFLAVKNTKIR